MAQVEVRGLRLAYDELNPGSPGTPVVLLHGWTADASEWRPVAERLAGRRVVLPEHRGHGRSEMPPNGRFAIGEMARDLAALLDRLSIPKCVLGGHSMGGMVAQRFALMFPDRVERLILSATSAKTTGGLRMAFLARFNGLLLLLATRGAARVNIRLAYHNATPGQLQRHLSTDPRTIRGAYLALLKHNAMEELGLLRVPTLVVVGTKDRLLPWGMSRELARRIPRARLVQVEGGSHSLMAEHTDAAAKAIEEFLSA